MKKPIKTTEEGQINITPMLDVVFIMLIFFIVTTSFAKETGVDVSRPQSSHPTKPKGNILIEVQTGGQILINKQSVSLSAVRSRIETFHAEKPEAIALIVSDPDVKTDDLVNIMDQVKSAGVDRISIAPSKS